MSSAKNSAGAPCTRQFLVTLTVQTTNINPTLTPTTRSATSLTNTHPLLGTPSDAQQDNALDGHAEGLVLFPGIGDKLTDDVSIAEVALYPPNGSKTPLARWTLPEPVAVPDLPRSE
ncbi:MULTISPECIES: hypothetical protein [unclassified Rhodococcus (in: high G+C Gram-positive bacteria)]|uniref:hypothetical protein n=2 Tax=unclassified Rhodococcus (in: high G+C Gram-positive bacteria) TaxID=192944 RepID=UPI0002FA0303|nr:hypothetical protein [Rhodococcus sp. DK17]